MISSNLKLVASLLQVTVLLTFARIARSPRETELEIKAIKARKKGEPLNQQNKDSVSEQLFTFPELSYVFKVLPRLLEELEELLLQWSDQTVKAALSSMGKPRLRRRPPQ